MLCSSKSSTNGKSNSGTSKIFHHLEQYLFFHEGPGSVAVYTMCPVRLLDGYQGLSIHYLGMHALATRGAGAARNAFKRTCANT